jgi:MFS transporter, DHA2 family, multidrug resistance protein
VLNSVYRGHVNTDGLSAQAAPAVDKGLSGGLAVAAETGSADLLNSVRDSFMTSLNTTTSMSAGSPSWCGARRRTDAEPATKP